MKGTIHLEEIERPENFLAPLWGELIRLNIVGVEIGQTDPKTDEEHATDLRGTIDLTRKYYGQGDRLAMCGVFFKNQETLICQTGTAPGSSLRAHMIAHLIASTPALVQEIRQAHAELREAEASIRDLEAAKVADAETIRILRRDMFQAHTALVSEGHSAKPRERITAALQHLAPQAGAGTTKEEPMQGEEAIWSNDGVLTVLPAYYQDAERVHLATLLVSDVEADREEIAKWADEQRRAVAEWALSVHAQAGDHEGVQVPTRPNFVRRRGQPLEWPEFAMPFLKVRELLKMCKPQVRLAVGRRGGPGGDPMIRPAAEALRWGFVRHVDTETDDANLSKWETYEITPKGSMVVLAEIGTA